MTQGPTARDRLLDATVEAAAIHGLARLSVGDVAQRAGLSRQTLYKHFPSRDALLAEAVLREAARIVEQVIAAAEAADADEPEASLEATILATLRVSREHPLLDRLVRTEPDALLPLVIGDGGPVAGAVRGVVEQIVAARFAELTVVEVRRLADMLSRLLISYAISAPDDPPEVVARFIATTLTYGLSPDPVRGDRPRPAAHP
ncbi:MAG: TetR/AcrR family transcriptional regulator [Acidimicrobiales bacterium]|nr:TetR/AcrR family transcriptional regulator [Acidimicrobiales bacterium]